MAKKHRLSIASVVLGVISILCSTPGIALLIIRTAHPDTLINTIITLSIVSLLSGLLGIMAGASGLTVAINQRDVRFITLNVAGLALAAGILLTL